VAATAVLMGSIWQAVLDVGRQLRAMNFLKAHNALVREGLKQIRLDVPWWRHIRRRRERRAMTQAVFATLSPDEATQAHDYDRYAWGWSMVVMGTFIGTIVLWVQVFVGP
jgi:hypothetical protein